jgi:CubicO group peptidase (beta-lactamase class C family)
MMRRFGIPGLSLAVVDRDGLLFAGAAGTADLVTGAPATTGTQYLWFSMTKVVTATAALRLADEGQLDLDAPADTYLAHLRAPGPRQPTVRDLLAHTSGLANPVPLRWARPADAATARPGHHAAPPPPAASGLPACRRRTGSPGCSMSEQGSASGTSCGCTRSGAWASPS